MQRAVVELLTRGGCGICRRAYDRLAELSGELGFDLVSTETVRNGALLELFYLVEMRKGMKPGDLVEALSAVNSGQRVTVLSGYDQTDI